MTCHTGRFVRVDGHYACVHAHVFSCLKTMPETKSDQINRLERKMKDAVDEYSKVSLDLIALELSLPQAVSQSDMALFRQADN